MAIKKGDSLKSMILADYFNIVQANQYDAKPKSVHFRKVEFDENGEVIPGTEVYLGYIIRSSKNQETEVDWNQPVLLDGAHGADWLGVSPSMDWKTK